MSVSPLIGLSGVVVLLAALTSGIPIGVALGVVGTGGLILVLCLEPALIKSGVILFETLSRYELGVLPLFLLMAHVSFEAGASRDLFDAAARLFGHRRGGMALASIGGCAGFGTISGSSLATAATIELAALPEMRRRRYSDALATGTIAAGGTLGQMVPPSAALIVFGIIAEQSGGSLKIHALWSGALVSSEHSMLEIRHGVADIGLITPIYVRGGAHLLRVQTGFYGGAATFEQQVALYRCLAEAFPQYARELNVQEKSLARTRL